MYNLQDLIHCEYSPLLIMTYLHIGNISRIPLIKQLFKEADHEQLNLKMPVRSMFQTQCIASIVYK